MPDYPKRLRRLPLAGLMLAAGLAFSPVSHAENAGAASADEPPTLEKTWTFSGFGTLGVVHARANGATFLRDITEPRGAANRGLTMETDTRVGFQVNLRISPHLEVVGQAVSHYRWDNNFEPELTWGFLKYSPHDDIDLRIGRVGFDALMAADTRDVGYSYLWARPPVEFYGTLPVPYVDGGDIVLRHPLGSGVGRLKLFSGLTRQKIPTFFGLIENLSGSRITGGFVDYQDTHWVARAGKADIRLANEFPDGGSDILGTIRNTAEAQTDATLKRKLNALASDTSLVGKHIAFSSLGLAYENGPLQAQTALIHFTSETLLYPESHSAYLSVGYRFDKITPYAMISAVKSRKTGRADELAGTGNPDVEAVSNVANYMYTTGQNVQNTFTIGMRYDFMDNAALKVQMDAVRNRNCSPVSLPLVGTSPPCSAPLLWPSVPDGWNGRATIYSAVLDFTF